MQKVYEVHTYEQAKVLSHKIRMSIIYIFSDLVPRTAKQLSDELGLPKSNVHYHVQELFRVGLLTLVETKEKGGVIEKYYLPIAEEFHIKIDEEPKERGEKSGQYLSVKTVLDEYRDSYLKMIQHTENTNEKKEKDIICVFSMYLTPEERTELQNEVNEVLKKWKEKCRKQHEGAEPYKILYAMHRKK